MEDTNDVLSVMNCKLDLKNTMNEYSIDDENNVGNVLTDTLIESNYFDLDKLGAHVHNVCNYGKQVLCVMHLNIRSLSKKFEKLKDLLVSLEDRCVYLDVILLCETYLHAGNENLFQLPGYNLICRNRSKMKDGGVAIYLKSNLEFKERPDLETFVEGEFETVFIEINILKQKTVLGEVYRIPNSNVLTSLDKFEHMLSKLKYEN